LGGLYCYRQNNASTRQRTRRLWPLFAYAPTAALPPLRDSIYSVHSAVLRHTPTLIPAPSSLLYGFTFPGYTHLRMPHASTSHCISTCMFPTVCRSAPLWPRHSARFLLDNYLLRHLSICILPYAYSFSGTCLYPAAYYSSSTFSCRALPRAMPIRWTTLPDRCPEPALANTIRTATTFLPYLLNTFLLPDMQWLTPPDATFVIDLAYY